MHSRAALGAARTKDRFSVASVDGGVMGTHAERGEETAAQQQQRQWPETTATLKTAVHSMYNDNGCAA